MQKQHKRVLIGLLTGFLIIWSISTYFYVKSKSDSIVQDTDGESKSLKVHFIDVGQGDAIFIDYGDYDILIDAGNNDDGDLVVDYLKKLGTDDIEIMVATHPHADHIGGLDDVLAAFDIENIIDSGKPAETKTYKDYWNAVQLEHANYQEDANMIFEIDEDLSFEVIEAGDDFKNTNDDSVITRLHYGDIDFLFTGDAEEEVERVLIEKNITAHVLKAGHHGSRSSTAQVFLDRVNPLYAIISCGTDNKYGHPHKETLERLNAANIRVFRTDLQGTIVATVEGKTVRFTTDR